jgi:hypothetical protein
MRQSIAVLLSILTLTLGTPQILVAQAPLVKTAAVRGELVDGGGRAVAGARIELVSQQRVVATTVSDSDGGFTFSGLAAADYVVRTMANGQPAGVRVSASTERVTVATIVLPSVATASPAVIAAIAPSLLSTLAVASAVVMNQAVVLQSADSDRTEVLENFTEVQIFLAGLASNGTITQGTLQDLLQAANNAVIAGSLAQ